MHAEDRTEDQSDRDEPDNDVAPLVVLNPRASRIERADRRARILEEVARAVRARTGRSPHSLVSDTLEETRAALLETVRVGRPLVIAIGGDGTAREAASDLAGTGVPLGIVPAGTANLFAATLGIPADTRRAAAAIATAQVRAVDLGRARWGPAADATADDATTGERVFVVACGTGFDARLMAMTTTGSKRRLGRWAYFAVGLRELRHVRGFDCRLELDGETIDLRAVQVLVANGGELIPGLLRPRLAIDPTDDRLDVFVVEGEGLAAGVVGAIEAVGRTALGRSRTGRSRRFRVRRVVVRPDPAQPIEIDGDVHGRGWLEATSLPGALLVLVPGSRGSPAGRPVAG